MRTIRATGMSCSNVRSERKWWREMVEPSKWDWADALSGLMLGIVSGILTLYGWFSRKVDAMHGRISTVKQTVNEQAASIKVLEANHEDALRRLSSIEKNSSEINRKQDRQMEILLDIQRRG